MNATTMLAAVLAAVFLAFGAAKVLAVPSMRARAAHVGFSVASYRGIGALEVAGATGLLVGTAVPLLRTAAAVGLLLLLVGAVTTHVRVKDGLKDLTPAVVLASLVVVLLALEVQQLA